MWNIRLFISLALLLGGQILLYFGCECFQKRFHNVLRPIDAHIPFVEWTVLIYVLWFPLIVLQPLALYHYSPDAYGVYFTAMVSENIISVICYLVYPTTFERPTPSGTVFGRLMKTVYAGSFRGVNCAPSLHCSSCYLTVFTAAACPGMPAILRLVFILIALGIVVSTMTTKQHAFIDAVTALPVMIVCLLIGQAMPAVRLLAWIAGA